MTYNFLAEKVCPPMISFDLEGDVVTNIVFHGGCNGNGKMVSKLLDGWTVDKIEEYCLGNICGRRGTSCADQLAIAVRRAANGDTEGFAEEDDED